MDAPADDDPLTRALAELLTSAGPLPGTIQIGPDGLLCASELQSREDVVQAFACSPRVVAYWRAKPWWPGTRDPEPFSVCAHELDLTLQRQGLATAITRRQRAGVDTEAATRVERRGGHRDPRLIARQGLTSLAQVLDTSVLDQPVELSDSVEADLDNSRRLEARVRHLLEALPSDSLADPTRARVFTALAETSSRILQRISQQEQALLKIQRERSELVEVAQAHSMASAVVTGFLRELDSFVQDCVDALKDLEISTYGTSRIDSLGVEDVIKELLSDARRRAVESLRKEGRPDAALPT